MKIHVYNKTDIRLSSFDEEGLDVTTETKALRFSALAMFVCSLGRCTFAVLDHYALRMDVPIENIVTRLTWEYSEDPTTIEHVTMKIYWPELPEKRVKSVQKASHKCAIHQTIKDCVNIDVEVFNEKE